MPDGGPHLDDNLDSERALCLQYVWLLGTGFNNLPATELCDRPVVGCLPLRIDGGQTRFIRVDDFRRWARHSHVPGIEPYRMAAKRANGIHPMTDEQDGAPAPSHVPDLVETLALKGHVADGQDLIDEQDFRIEVGRDREAQAHEHAARVVLYRCIEKLLRLGEGHNIVELAIDLGPLHPQDRAIEINVLAPGQFWMKAGPHFQ